VSDHVYGWRGPAPEPQRFAEADTEGLHILGEVDPRKQLPPVFNQLQLGACTANATNAAFEYDAHLDGKKTGRLSRLWTYYQERKLEGTLGQGDTGAYGYDAFRAAAKVGIPAEADWPYKIATFEGPPPAKATKDAILHYHLQKTVHQVPQNQQAIKAALSNRQTIAFGFAVFSSFEDDAQWEDGRMPIPARGEQTLGGHEVLLVGYLEHEPQYALARNSWGADWQELGGYFLFPWRVLLAPNICSDFRTIVRPAGK
jgi:C1A family cysteine protease